MAMVLAHEHTLLRNETPWPVFFKIYSFIGCGGSRCCHRFSGCSVMGATLQLWRLLPGGARHLGVAGSVVAAHGL